MSWPAGDCGVAGPQQRMDGAVSGCLRVAPISPGPYTVSLQQVIGPAGATAAGGASTGAATAGLALTVSPMSGPPGTRLQITGSYVAPPVKRPDHADVCWDGCPGGLSYSGVPLTWTSATTFTTAIVVPAAPWVTGSPPRITLLTSGRYTIGVQCLGEARGCAGLGPQATASFDLKVPPGGAPPGARRPVPAHS